MHRDFLISSENASFSCGYRFVINAVFQILEMVAHETSISTFWLISFNARVHSVLRGLVNENCSKKGMLKSNVRFIF